MYGLSKERGVYKKGKLMFYIKFTEVRKTTNSPLLIAPGSWSPEAR